MTRNCLMCANLRFEMGYGPLSDVTPGEDAEIACFKGGDFATIDEDSGKQDLFNSLRTAETCDQFAPTLWAMPHLTDPD